MSWFDDYKYEWESDPHYSTRGCPFYQEHYQYEREYIFLNW